MRLKNKHKSKDKENIRIFVPNQNDNYMSPINNVRRTVPPVTLNIIIITVICWIAQLLFEKTGTIDITNFLGLHFFKADNFYPHQLITYMFMHATYDSNGNIVITHILFNMFAVYMFGRTLEMVWGSKRFLFYYIVTGLGAGIVQELTWLYDFRDILSNAQNLATYQVYLDMVITVGASGAVFGILVAFGMLFPNAELMIIPIPIPIKAKYFVVLYGALELYLGLSNYSGDNVAHFAHLGGLLFGIIIVLYWKKQNKKNGRFF